MVLSVRRQRGGVFIVRASRLHRGDQILIPEELPDVADGTTGDSAVGELSGIFMYDDVDVYCTARVLVRVLKQC